MPTSAVRAVAHLENELAEKLPIFPTVLEAYGWLLRNSNRVGAYAWLATLLIAASDFAMLHRAEAAQLKAVYGGALLTVLVAVVQAVQTLAFIPVVTSTHRLILQGRHGRTGVGYRREEWAFLWTGAKLIPRSLLAWVAAFLPVGAVYALLMVRHVAKPTMLLVCGPLAAVAALAAAAFLMRYQMAFPAAALGGKLTFGDSARLLKGNGFRLFAAVVICTVPCSVLRFLLGLLIDRAGVPILLLQAMASVALAVVCAACVSFAYRRFVNEKDS